MAHSSRSKTLRALASAAALSTTTLLFACSGGGGSDTGQGSGGTGSGGTPTPTPTISAFATPESTARFLTQATTGANMEDIERLTGTSPSTWFKSELAKPVTLVAPAVEANIAANPNDTGSGFPKRKIWSDLLSADDQLRQRMAYALSQILVISYNSTVGNRTYQIAGYEDVLSQNAFGNYRDLLEAVTYSEAMGQYLTYKNNQKADAATGRTPDENYAREIMQLFTIGVIELNMDGTPKLNNGQQVETYTNDDVFNLARVFTGLQSGDRADKPMVMNANRHSPEEKAFLGSVIPANTPGEESIDQALDILFEHPNVAPFISRQLIQRFTASNPSPDYVERVANTFERGTYVLPDNSTVGTGRRGDLTATLASILFDEDAQDPNPADAASAGKIREPVLRFAQWVRAFDAPAEMDDVLRENLLPTSMNTPTWLGQSLYQSPSVFNYYRPGHIAPGTQSGAAGLTAPELQITNETSVPGYLNTMSRYARVRLPSADIAAGSFVPDYTDELALAHNAPALIDRLDLLLTHGSLPEDTKTAMVDFIDDIPIRTDTAEREASDREDRVHAAVMLVLAAPEYIVLQ